MFLIAFTFIIAPCFGTFFDCEEGDGQTVNGIRLLVNCTLRNFTENANFITWKKYDQTIGRCTLSTSTCSRYHQNREWLYLGICGSNCFSLGITQPMSSEFIGEYYIHIDIGTMVTELALNLTSHRNVDSAESTASIQQSTSHLSIYRHETTFPVITSEQNFEFTESVIILSCHTSQLHTRKSQEVTETNVVLIFFIALVCTTPICLGFIGHKIYKHLKSRQSVIVASVSRHSNSHDHMRVATLSGSAHEIHCTSTPQPIISQSQLREHHDPHSYQALHQGPKPPPRTSNHLGERNQQGNALAISGCVEFCNESMEAFVGTAGDVDNVTVKRSAQENSVEQVNSNADGRLYETKIFVNHGSTDSFRSFPETGREYEDMDFNCNWRDVDACQIQTIPNVASGADGGNMRGNSEETASFNVHYDTKIFGDKNNTYSRSVQETEKQSDEMKGEEYLEMEAGYIILE